MKKYQLFLIYFVFYMYLEFILKFFSNSNIFTLSNINILAFVIFLSILSSIITRLFYHQKNKVIMYIIFISTSLIYCIQYGVNKVFNVYYSLEFTSAANGVLDFKSEIISLIKSEILVFLLFLLPLAILHLYRFKINYRPPFKKRIVLNSVLLFWTCCAFIMSLNVGNNTMYSSFNLYFKYNNMVLSVDKLGLLNALFTDTYKNLTNFKENVVLTVATTPSLETKEEVVESEVIYGKNILDINFSMINETEELIQMSNYFLSDEGTSKNEFTGMFEGKNLIYILAETFNELAVDENRTPTLYKMVNEGFNFTNFYSPTIYSTIGGEFQLLTGIYPASNTLSAFKTGENTYYNGIASSFTDIGYSSYAYHNNTYTFQDRNYYIPSLGFNSFTACGNGLEALIDCNWIQSDSDMISVTVDDYMNSNSPFVTFYATVSGHGDYTYSHKYAEKYLPLVSDEYSEGIRSYLAAQIELDRALELLLTSLEKKGILEDTVIVLAGDHYPYLLEVSEINTASSYERDEIIEINSSNLIIYNSEMDPVVVDKVGSQIDVLPTVFNLFGINYDSRLIIGKDILSTEPGLAMFADRSWVSDYGSYFSTSNIFIPNEGYKYNGSYIEAMNEIVSNKINISSLIMTEDYYKYIKENN